MNNFDNPTICNNCLGYKTMPYNWNNTTQPRMCICPKENSLAWECPRCKKINAPWKGSCDCTPSPLSNAPASSTAEPVPFNHYFNNSICTDAKFHFNKNFTDK